MRLGNVLAKNRENVLGFEVAQSLPKEKSVAMNKLKMHKVPEEIFFRSTDG